MLFALLLSFTATAASADVFEVGGIYYSKNSDGTTVSVTSGDVSYTGEVNIPSQVTYGDSDYSVTSIGEKAFNYCTELTAVTIPNTVTSIGDFAFAWCVGLTSITIPGSVTTIGNYAFSGSNGFTSVTIPASVTSIGDYAFWDCNGLETIAVAEGNSVYDSRDNCNAIIETATNTLIFGMKNTVIPNTVATIGSHAFWNCSLLTSVTVPASVTKIGDYAFWGCTGLEYVFLDSGVTYIGANAFYACTGVTTLFCAAATPPALGEDALKSINKGLCSLHVPDESIEAYRAADQWKDFNNTTSGVNDGVTIEDSVEVAVAGGVLHCGGVRTSVYTLGGVKVYDGTADVELSAGMYIVVAAGRARKVVVR